MNKPTCEQILKGELGEPLSCHDDMPSCDGDVPPYRARCYRTEIYRRLEDETFWLVGYRHSTDGEENQLRDGTAIITRVEPYRIVETRYTPIAD